MRVAGQAAAISRAAVRPPPGMAMSRMMTSGSSVRASARAEAASPASPTTSMSRDLAGVSPRPRPGTWGGRRRRPPGCASLMPPVPSRWSSCLLLVALDGPPHAQLRAARGRRVARRRYRPGSRPARGCRPGRGPRVDARIAGSKPAPSSLTTSSRPGGPLGRSAARAASDTWMAWLPPWRVAFESPSWSARKSAILTGSETAAGARVRRSRRDAWRRCGARGRGRRARPRPRTSRRRQLRHPQAGGHAAHVGHGLLERLLDLGQLAAPWPAGRPRRACAARPGAGWPARASARGRRAGRR